MFPATRTKDGWRVTFDTMDTARHRLAEWMVDRYGLSRRLRAIYRLRFVPVPGLGTFASDLHGRVYFDPTVDWNQHPDDIKRDEVVAALYHEFLHIWRRHGNRCRDQQAQPTVWNVAADCEIDQLIRDEGFTLPEGKGPLPEHYGLPDGSVTEWYYGELYQGGKEPEECENGDGEGTGSQSGDSSGGSGQSGDDESQDSDGDGSGSTESDGQESSASAGKVRSPKTGAEHHKCGSSATGEKADWELDPDDEEYPGMDPEDVADMVAETKEEMATGSDPGTVSRMANAVFGSLEGFESALQRVWLVEAGREVSEVLKHGGRGFSRPSRREVGGGVMLPGTQRRFPVVTFINDVSGSIGTRAAMESFKVAEHFKGWEVKFRVVACDTEAKEIRPGDGGYSGGGTDLRKGWEWVKKHAPETELVVVITDGHTPWDADNPLPHVPSVVMTWSREGPEWAKTRKMPPLTAEGMGY